ncbi:receptor-like serine/threonine-protein kinase NCRK [Impatiens glandulifera]|uniref:receptor-like serine/threonine-protein kinase NCRK n=1 Tax=Impatiens glandulifera TaxID=253017 RepID=UPI001FB16044|nr:receptor-like serine/threonine-protein kinase NCRK [Impatiens glandulifera]
MNVGFYMFEGDKWMCTCSFPNEDNHNLAHVNNCSTSCHCSTDEALNSRWTCICDADKSPEVAGNHTTSCFAGCECGSGSDETKSYKKLMSGKTVVIIFLSSALLTVVVFTASVLCCVYRKAMFHVSLPPFGSDKETSCNSSTNLISHGASSLPEFKVHIGPSPIKHIAGYICGSSCFFQRKEEAVHGVITQFSYSELENGTNKFCKTNLIGIGGSSHVYRGHLKDGQIVAVKRLKTHERPETIAVFLTEIALISRLNHCHVVPLLGYCSENKGKYVERLLVYEYLSNGNLRDCLNGSLGKWLDWRTRVAIALGAAKGLEYLHDAAAPHILHRDVKSTNILLDRNWKAKITDLGMAQDLTDGLPSCSSSPARILHGTFGYFAPEYAIVGKASRKSDVFSFGVVLLELISGRQAIHKSSSTNGDESLVIWGTPRLQDSSRVILELADPQLKRKYPEEEMQVMAYLAKECLLMDPDDRPTMSEVVQILSTIAPQHPTRLKIPVNILLKSTKCIDIEVNNEDEEEEEASDKITECCDSIKWEDESRRLLNQLNENQNVTSSSSQGGEEEYVIFPISKSVSKRSWNSQEDESVVDLTEPRFETFCVESRPSDLPQMA